MDTKVYEKTRYQNIYRHKKNKNYLVMISKPVKSSISNIDGKKILKLEEALKIRDNPKIKLQKGSEILYNNDFDGLWFKYINCCKNELRQAYNTYHKKEKVYSKYLKSSFSKKLSKLSKNDFITFLNKLDTTEKQKNEILKILKAFFSWCIEEEHLIINPVVKIKNYKVEKHKMKYWIPTDVQKFFTFINNYIETCKDSKEKEIAYRIKIFVLLGFSLGDRVGETRILTFGSINRNNYSISINHSIEYNPKSNDYFGKTKTYGSQRNIDISPKIIDEIDYYRYYLINELDYEVNDNTLIFLNHTNQKPFTDVTLRKQFYKFCDMANVPHIRMYDLRHTYVATMMAEGKELYLISERLGHTSFSTTVNKYGHLSNEVRKEIAESTDKYL